MTDREDELARAEQHVRQGEEGVARQAKIIEEMIADGHPYAAEVGRRLLKTLQDSLKLARERLREMQGKRSL